jgi:hypothetical protein
MKKLAQRKKLALKQETVRMLSQHHLGHAVGGALDTHNQCSLGRCASITGCGCPTLNTACCSAGIGCYTPVDCPVTQ